jgi:hypothetical protein
MSVSENALNSQNPPDYGHDLWEDGLCDLFHLFWLVRWQAVR